VIPFSVLVLQILLNIVATGFISFTKVVVTSKIQQDSRDKKQHSSETPKDGQPTNEDCALKWCGVSIQIGSFLGAILFFLIVDVGMRSSVDNFFSSCQSYPQW
jgi:large-conductance mechanosensitive channel